MWHEARRQERKIRGMLVDYRRRAERRRDFYEKIKADPTQFLQLHGRQYKIHLDPAIASTADSPAAMMPWQGQTDNLIDRFDVRAHLDFIPPIKKQDDEMDLTYEERQINYERYRIIAQNSFLCISEEKFLKQLHLEEQFGYTEPETKKKKNSGAAIGFNYDDGTAPSYSAQPAPEENSEDDSDSDLDVDLYINVSKIDQYQAHEMNKHGLSYGMSSNDFYSFLTNDMEEAESNRLAREEEHEKALFSGRKSRRERRAHREKRLANRVISPPSYAARSSPTYPSFRESKSASRSPSPENAGKITYITSFGGEDDPPSTSKSTYADKVKFGKKPKRLLNSSLETKTIGYEKKKQKSESLDRDRNYRRRRRSRSSESRSPSLRRQSRTRNRFRKHSRSRSNDRRRTYRPRRPSSSASESRRRSNSRSRSRRSKSGSPSCRNRSKSSSSDSSHVSKSVSRSSSKSRSPSARRESPKVTVQRYYGRKRSDQSSSSDMDVNDISDADSENKAANSPASGEKCGSYGNAGSSFKKTVVTMSLQERLKRKRQALLNKQFKADKLAEQLKTEREKQEQQNREDELREMAIKLRRRQREIRHAYDSHSSSNSSDSDSKKSTSSTTKPRPRSHSDSPEAEKKDDREHRSRDSCKERDKSRERKERDSQPSSSKNSPVSRYSEKRTVYRDDNVEKEREPRRRDDYKKDSRDSRDYRESRRDEHRDGGKSLVNY